jgi:site-specific recombinase XerD
MTDDAFALSYTDTAPPALPEAEATRAQALAANSLSDATLRAYDTRWRLFAGWCRERGVECLPADPLTVATWVGDCGLAYASINVTLAAIGHAHKLALMASPTTHPAVRATLRGLAREQGTAQRQVRPLRLSALRRVLDGLPDDYLGQRDRALLLLAFAGGFRRSEIAGLDQTDLAWMEEGLVVTLRRSKTDQTGAGRKVAVPYGSDPATCPVRAVRRWLEVKLSRGDAGAALFASRQGARLCGAGVAGTVKRRAQAVGLDATDLSGHSLRAGFATEAAAQGASERAIARQTGHRNLQTLRKYIREGTLWRENAATKLGL